MAARGTSLLQWLPRTTVNNPGLALNPSTHFHSPVLSRCLSTASSARPQGRLAPFRLDHVYPQSHTRSRIVGQKRYASYGSSNMLASLEQKANNTPGNFVAQNAFYAALLRANMPAVVVDRIQTGRYAANQITQGHYSTALRQLGTGGAAAVGQSQNSNLSNDTLQSVAQAVAARANGASGAMAARLSGAADQGSKKSPIYVVTEESWGQTIFKWGKMLLYFGLSCYVVLIGVHLLVDATGIIRRATGTQHVEASEQKARFSDIQGCEEAKDDLLELVEFLKNPTEFSALGGKLPKGVLLTGPPGTGKTLLARAVAGESGVPFFYAAGSEFDEMYVGVGAKRIRELFSVARSKSPAIIFIDELDAVGGKRSEKEASYHKQTLNQLLTELDGFEKDSGVIVIGATNFPESLDKALTRPGRFDRQVPVPLPDVRGRLALFDWYLNKVKTAPSVDAEPLARMSTGMSGADIENLVNQAAVRASKNHQKAVTKLDLEWAFDKISMGPERKSAVIKEEDKLSTAYHEAGHALVGMFTEGANQIYKATIMPRGQALGITYTLPGMDDVSITKEQLSARLAMLMGGKVAEELIYGELHTTTGCSSDLAMATSTATHMVVESGMSKKLGDVHYRQNTMSVGTRNLVDEEIRELMAAARQQAWKVLTEKEKELHLLAKGLVKHELLDLEEIKKIIAGEELPDRSLRGPGDSSKPGPSDVMEEPDSDKSKDDDEQRVPLRTIETLKGKMGRKEKE